MMKEKNLGSYGGETSPEEWEIPGYGGQPILAHTQYPTDSEQPVCQAIICHGFKGYMDYSFMPRLAHTLAESRILTHRFNFSHSGMTREIETFAKPELFELDTWNRQIFDLTEVIKHVRQLHPDLPVCLIGHSRGGVTALLCASKLGADMIKFVITLAAPADALRLDPLSQQTLLREGRIPSISNRTGQTLYVGRDWLAEIQSNPDSHDPLAASAKLENRAVHIHGDADETVSVDDLSRYSTANPSAQTYIVPGANHVFNAPNPLPIKSEVPAQTASMMKKVLQILSVEIGH